MRPQFNVRCPSNDPVDVDATVAKLMMAMRRTPARAPANAWTTPFGEVGELETWSLQAAARNTHSENDRSHSHSFPFKNDAGHRPALVHGSRGDAPRRADTTEVIAAESLEIR